MKRFIVRINTRLAEVREAHDHGGVAAEYGVRLDQMHLQSAVRNGARVGAVAPVSACTAATSDLVGNDVGNVTCELVTEDGIDIVFDADPSGLAYKRA